MEKLDLDSKSNNESGVRETTRSNADGSIEESFRRMNMTAESCRSDVSSGRSIRSRRSLNRSREERSDAMAKAHKIMKSMGRT